MGNRLRLQDWVCVTCEKSFPRKWNASRHAAEQHPGQSSQVVRVIEYLAGRQSGIYQPPSQAQSLSAPLSTRKSSTTITDILRVFQSSGKVEQNGNSPTNVMTREFIREVARQLAANCVGKAQQQSLPTLVSNLHPMAPQSHFLSNFLIPTGNELEIFGFRGHVCSRCLTIQHLAVSYPPSELGCARGEIRHMCDPDLLASNQNLDDKVKQARFTFLNQNLPTYLKGVVSLWNSRGASIAGIELRSILLTRPPPNDQIKIPHPKVQDKSVTFQYSMEKYVELQHNLGDDNPDHWSVRVLHEGRTSLADHELQGFLNLVKNATFGIFNIDTQKTDRNRKYQRQFLSETQIQQSPSHCYFMYLSREE